MNKKNTQRFLELGAQLNTARAHAARLSQEKLDLAAQIAELKTWREGEAETRKALEQERNMLVADITSVRETNKSMRSTIGLKDSLIEVIKKENAELRRRCGVRWRDSSAPC